LDLEQIDFSVVTHAVTVFKAPKDWWLKRSVCCQFLYII